MFKLSVVLAIFFIATISVARSQTSKNEVVIQRNVTTEAQLAFNTCRDEYDRISRQEDRDWRTAVRANAERPDNPTLPEIKRALVQTREAFERQDLELWKKQKECDKLDNQWLAALLRLKNLCDAQTISAAADTSATRRICFRLNSLDDLY